MSTMDLSGTWRVRHDPFNAGVLWRWHDRTPADGWLDIAVPSAWQSVLGTDAHGVAWYRRMLPADVLAWARDARSRVRLRFESVATDCRVWVNGVEAGRHIGDYVPFEFDITAPLLAAPDRAPELVVRVDQINAPRPAKGTVTENGHITKGFHDVLSIQHAGIWGGVSVRRTGQCAPLPNGVRVRADPRSASTLVRVELEPNGVASAMSYTILDPDGVAARRGVLESAPGQSVIEHQIALDGRVATWCPESPNLYTLRLDIRDAPAGNGAVADEHTVRFGFRTIETGGRDRRRVLLNGRPLLLRGVLHWGHEPRHLAPSPPPEQVREEFMRLRALGFNCVCLCMVYMPEHYYDIADQTGMLIWQEHPVWKSRTEPEFHAEYHRLFESFMRRDARHPSVILVSASCEHEAFHPGLSAWWWKRAREVLPDRLLQSQTAFTSWTNPAQTDLHDEHVYDNTGRWACFLHDVRAALQELPPAPFVMGETIIANHWPRPEARAGSSGNDPWWACRGARECAAFESDVGRRFGPSAAERFVSQADPWALRLRKTQAEMLRCDPANAGWVMNHIRDVPACRCGFKDDQDRWRFTPERTIPWLGDASILLRTPGFLTAHRSGDVLDLEVGVSNFGAVVLSGEIVLSAGSGRGEREIGRAGIECDPGEVAFGAVHLGVPACEGVRRLELLARAPGSLHNSWDLWFLPRIPAPTGGARLDGLPFTGAEREPEFEERAYSSGWGLACRSWRPRLPDPAQLEPGLTPLTPDAAVPDGTGVVLTHRLTRPLIEFLRGGGRVVLLASRHSGSIPSRFLNLYAGVPLVIEGAGSFLGPGESRWVCDLLAHDLTARCSRAVPVEELGIADAVSPMVRFVQTHDSGVPRVLDMVFAVRYGAGTLLVSTLDHGTAAGAYVLRRLLAAEPRVAPDREEPDLCRWMIA